MLQIRIQFLTVVKKSSGSTCKFTYECKDTLSPSTICNSGRCCATDMFPLNGVCSKFTVNKIITNCSFYILNSFFLNKKASKLYLYFYTTNFTTKKISTYKSSILFSALTDVKVIESPTYYIYVSDNNGALAQYNQSGSYIRYRATDCYYLAIIEGGNIYATSPSPGTNQMFIFSQTLGIVSQPLVSTSTYVNRQYVIRYDTNTKYLYQVDHSTQYVNVLDTTLTRIGSKSIDTSLITAQYNPRSVGFYKAGTVNLIYIGFRNGRMAIVDLATKAVRNVISNVCLTTTAIPADVYIHQTGNYMVVACHYDDILTFYTTTTVQHTQILVKH